jgi:hypothetical protein
MKAYPHVYRVGAGGSVTRDAAGRQFLARRAATAAVAQAEENVRMAEYRLQRTIGLL